MPTFLSDPSSALYLILALAFIVTLGVWFIKQTRAALFAMLIALVLLAFLVVIDVMVDSPREEAVVRVRAMAAAATARDPDAFVVHVSKSFDYRGAGRERIRTAGVWEMIRQYNARAAVWAFDKSDFQQLSDHEFEMSFMAKGEAQTAGARPFVSYVKGTFVRDPDGKHRLKTLKFFQPIDTRQEETLPGFP